MFLVLLFVFYRAKKRVNKSVDSLSSIVGRPFYSIYSRKRYLFPPAGAVSTFAVDKVWNGQSDKSIIIWSLLVNLHYDEVVGKLRVTLRHL